MVQYAASEFARAMTDVGGDAGNSARLTLNDWVVYYLTEVAAMLPVHRGMRNRKGRKLTISREAALASPATRIGATCRFG